MSPIPKVIPQRRAAVAGAFLIFLPVGAELVRLECADRQANLPLGGRELDDFHRDWPNIIVADEATIISVDEKWDRLGIGPFITSPSLRFKGQMYGEEAVVQ